MEEKESFLKSERSLLALKEILEKKDLQIEKIMEENKQEARKHVEEIAKYKVFFYIILILI